METLEFIKKAEGGKITINVPQNLNGKDLRITVAEASTEKAENTNELANKKVKDFMKYFGTAKFPGIDLDEYNVYEQ
jgi:hypothetical protein